MRKTPKTVAAGLFLLTLLVGCGPVAESQTLRERLAERRSERLAGQAGGGGLRAAAQVPAGMQQAEITVGGLRRSFYYHVPAGGPSRPGAVLALHGGGADAARFMGQVPSLPAYADREGFVAVYPDGIDQWNDGRANFAGKPDDVAFMRALVDWLSANLGVDRSRVFAFGPSNGGVMSYKIACDAPDLVAAIAPFVANMNTTLYNNCRPTQPTPVMITNGTADPLMVYDGGAPTSALSRLAPQGDSITSTEQTVQFWANVNNCSGRSATDLPDRANDGTTVTLFRYDCPPGAAVWLYRIEGGGHTIPGGSSTGPMAVRLVGPTSQDIDGVARAIEFFSSYGL